MLWGLHSRLLLSPAPSAALDAGGSTAPAWHMAGEMRGFHKQGFGVWPLWCPGGCCRTGGVGLGQHHLLQGHPASFERHCEPGCKCVCSLLNAGTAFSRQVPCQTLLVNVLNYRDLQM